MMKTIILDAGHGGKDIGATFNGLNEADITLITAFYLEHQLKRAGYKVIMTRDIDEYIALDRRAYIANSNKADIFISIHVNADPDDDTDKGLQAKGEEIWVYKNSEKGRELAEFLAVTVDCIFSNTKFRGIKETDRLYVLKHTKMPAVLLELGFLDNLKENNYFSKLSSYKDISNLIFKGIENYFKG